MKFYLLSKALYFSKNPIDREYLLILHITIQYNQNPLMPRFFLVWSLVIGMLTENSKDLPIKIGLVTFNLLVVSIYNNNDKFDI